MAFTENRNAVFDQKAVEWMARKLAEYERRAHIWKTSQEELFKSKLDGRLAGLKQHAES